MRVTFSLLAVFGAFLASAAGVHDYPVFRLTEKPVLDGNPDDAVWNHLPHAEGFFRIKRDGFAWRKPTSFRMGWDDTALYIAVRCQEPFRHRIHPLPDDGDRLWSDESVELFFSPTGTGYWQFAVNTVGARWNGRGSLDGTEEVPVGEWDVAAGSTGDHWTAEVRIPFSVLGRIPKVGDVWQFNIGRNAVLGPAEERHSSWAPVQRGFADVSAFASLIFKGMPEPDAATAVTRRMNEPYRAFCAEQHAGLVTPVRNGSFEAGLEHWGRRLPDRISIDETTSTLGRQSMCLDGALAPAEAPVHVAASQTITLQPGTEYLLRADIKRSKFAGQISVDVIERDAKDAGWTYHRCGSQAGEGDVAGEWERHEIRFRTSDNLLEARVMLYNIGSDAVAWFDNIQLLEDDDGSAGEQLAPKAARTLLLQLDTRDATATVLIDGAPVEAVPGEPVSATVREGMIVIGVEATAQGRNPGVTLTFPEHPETNGRWRVSGAQDVPAAWVTEDYDDTSWEQAAPAANGFVWPGGGSERMCMRQVLLWNRSHHGPDRCILPLVREWGISEGSVETVWTAVYSPFSYPVEDYEFMFDVPAEFRLLDFMHENGRHVLNTRPSGCVVEQVTHDGQPYTRYRIAFPKDRMYTGKRDIYSRYLLLPVFLEEWTGEAETTAWYFRRQAKGNFTELLQKIPVRILPPINGRMLKDIMISQYGARPWVYSQLSYEHLKQHCTQSFQAGFNTWVFSIRPAQTTQNDPYLAALYDHVTSAERSKIVLWANYPYHGTKERAFGTAAPDTRQFLYKWMTETPAARARYWNDSDTWEAHGQWCPTYALGEGRERFYREILGNYREKTRFVPDCSIIWSDFEQAPWAGASVYSRPKDGTGSWCFCDRCKAAFREWAKLDPGADLSDTGIFAAYREKWHSFRSHLDGEIAGIARRAANELGRDYMMYSWMAHREFWTALKGNIDKAFPGDPGNGVANAYQQRSMDRNAEFLRDECGMPRLEVMGQRFAFFHFYAWQREHEHRDYWRKWTVLSNSGYIEPRSWKTQVLRVVAAHGLGVDLHSSIQCPAGMLYWIGEATRILAEFEEVFHDGERADELAECDKLAYPNVLVLKRGPERVVLLFNEDAEPVDVLLRNRDILPGQTAAVYETGQTSDTPAAMRVTVPAHDVAVVHLK